MERLKPRGFRVFHFDQTEELPTEQKCPKCGKAGKFGGEVVWCECSGWIEGNNA